MRVFTRSKGLLATAPSAPVRVPAAKRFHAGAGPSWSGSGCRALRMGANRPMRNMFLDASRTIATGRPRYRPPRTPSCSQTLRSASAMLEPYFPPGSCVSVLARSMGFVPRTARQDARPASGENDDERGREGEGRGRNKFESASVGSEKNEKRMFRIFTSQSACERDSAPNAAIRTRRAKRSLGLPLGARRSRRARGEGTRARDPRAGRGRTRHGRPRWDFDLQRLALERAAAREEVAGGRGGGDHRQSAEPTACAKRARRRGCTDRRAPFGVRDGARGAPASARAPRRVSSFRDAPVFAGAGAAAGIARATPPQPTQGAVLFCSTRPRRRAARRRAAGARAGGTGRGRETPRALSPRGAPTSRARVRRAQPRTAGGVPPRRRTRSPRKASIVSIRQRTPEKDRSRIVINERLRLGSARRDRRPDAGSFGSAPTVPRGTPEGRVRARFAAMATPVSGLYPGGSPYGSIRGTPASGAGYPGADPYARRAPPGRARAPTRRCSSAAAPPLGVDARAPRRVHALVLRRARVRRRTHPSAPRRVRANAGLFGGGVGPASASASGEKDLRRGRQAPRRRPPAPPPTSRRRAPAAARDPSPARVDGGGSPRFGSARGGQQSGSGSPRFGARVMGMGARRRESFDDRRESFGAGGQHEGTPWANRRRGEGRRAAPSSIGGDARNSPFDAGGRRAEGGLGPVGAAAAPTRPRFGGARDEDGPPPPPRPRGGSEGPGGWARTSS